MMKVRPVGKAPAKRVRLKVRRPSRVKLLQTYGHARKGERYAVLTGGTLGGVPVYMVQTGERKVVVPVSACKEV